MQGNYFELTGAITKTGVEVKALEKKDGGCTFVAKFSISKKTKDGFEYFNVTFFGEENCTALSKLGEKATINVKGHLQQNVYMNKHQEKISTINLVGKEFCEVVYDEESKQYIEVVKEKEGLNF